MATTAIRARRVYVAGRETVDDAVVVVEDGRVREVGPQTRVTSPGVEHLTDLGDSVLIPGLIDSHVHLALEPFGAPPAQIDAMSDDRITSRMIANATELLAAGVTTARDLGAPTVPALAARRALSAGGSLRLLVAGAPITAQGAHLHFFGGAVATAAHAAELVHRQASAGVDWIKLVLSGGEITPGSTPCSPGLPEAAARAAVTAARACGLPVAAHAHTAAAAALAVALGVDSVEHCTLLGDDPAGPVAPRVVCPTANSRWLTGPDRDRRTREARLTELRRRGTTLIAGTDAGIPGVGFGNFADGLLALHRAGLRPDEVLAAATSTAAAALGLSDRGTLQPGRLADLVALAADPFDDLGVLCHPRAVFVAGRRVSGR